jgi:linoleate 9S-lipoxygenase
LKYDKQCIQFQWFGENLDAFQWFGEKLIDIENQILDMNEDMSLSNRNGPVQVPYTLLYPSTSDHTWVGGLIGRGILNSVSI